VPRAGGNGAASRLYHHLAGKANIPVFNLVLMIYAAGSRRPRRCGGGAAAASAMAATAGRTRKYFASKVAGTGSLGAALNLVAQRRHR